MRVSDPAQPLLFEVGLPALALEGGGRVLPHVARGFWWGPEADLPALRGRATVLRPSSISDPAAVVRRSEGVRAPAQDALELAGEVPTILVVHALTGDA